MILGNTYIQRKALSELFRVRDDFSALIRRKRGQLTSVEPGVFESETTVHTIGSELERLLLDIPLQLQKRV